MAGLPASGKSAIAQRLANQLHAVLLDKDQVRAFLFKDNVDYEREQDDLCVNVMYNVARYHLSKRPATPVILDGRSYSRHYQVEAVKDTAMRANVALFFIECTCAPGTARLRLESDQGLHLAKNRDYEMYERSRTAADVIDEPKITLDTDNNSESECLQMALSYLKTRS
jgi:predicted kinase